MKEINERQRSMRRGDIQAMFLWALFFAIGLGALLLALPLHFAQAATDGYHLLEPLPAFLGASDPNAPTLIEYLGLMYKFIIALAGVLAVVMIIIAGIEYIFSPLPSTKSDAKKRIIGAIGGLLLCLTGWIILNTIDSNLLKKGFDLEHVGAREGATVLSDGSVAVGGKRCFKVKTPAAFNYVCEDSYKDCKKAALSAGYGEEKVKQCQDATVAAEKSSAEETSKRSTLTAAGVDVNRTNGCGSQTFQDYAKTHSGGCTSIGGLPPTTINDLTAFGEACKAKKASGEVEKCETVVTGGAELGHATHGPGKNVIDLRNTASTRQMLGYGKNAKPQCGSTGDASGLACHFECQDQYDNTTGVHWHCTAH